MIEKILEKNFPGLSNLPELNKEIIDRCSILTFQQGEILLREGQYVKVIPLLISGYIKVYKEDEKDGEILLYYIKPGESCVMSMTALIENEKSKIKAIAESNVEIIAIPSDAAIKIAHKYPIWNQFVYHLFSQKYEELLGVITTLTFSNKDRFLLDYLRKQVELNGDSIVHKTHQEIALDLGSSREVVSRLLKKLEKNGFVKLSHARIVLLAE
jgi:CRP/FNR family transcriptional regulator, anaerobic regulatory protein